MKKKKYWRSNTTYSRSLFSIFN